MTYFSLPIFLNSFRPADSFTAKLSTFGKRDETLVHGRSGPFLGHGNIALIAMAFIRDWFPSLRSFLDPPLENLKIKKIIPDDYFSKYILVLDLGFFLRF